MLSALPAGLGQAFAIAAGELGMCGAAWLYVENVSEERGEAGVVSLRDALGRSFPVLDAVAEQWLRGERRQPPETRAVVEALAGATEVVIVGLEAFHLDALLPQLGRARCALLCHSPLEVSWSRVLSNFGGRVESVDLESYQRLAGPTSVLLTFAYGIHGRHTHVAPGWLRATGEDVRTQFRSLVAWDVLRAPMYVYPRWLVEVDLAAFTHLV